jgi:hypothetical protein
MLRCCFGPLLSVPPDYTEVSAQVGLNSHSDKENLFGDLMFWVRRR